RAAEARDRIATIRESIPDDRMRFRLSEKAADQGAVTFTPDRWRALLAVNGERAVAAIAEQLRLGKMQTLTLLSGLVKDGVIEGWSPAENRPADRPAPYAAPEPAPPPEPLPPPPATEAWPPPDAHEEAARPTPDWSSSTAPSRPTPEAPREQRAQPEQVSPPPPIREDLQNEIAQRMGGFAPVPEPPPPAVEVPPAVDDRLSSLSGLFAPGPAANVPQPQTPAPATKETPPQEPKDWWRERGSEQNGKARFALECAARRIQQRWLRQGQDRDASRESPHACRRAGRPDRSAVAGRG